MIMIENECVGCPPEMGCLGSCCPNRNVKRVYCDICGEEISDNSSRYDIDRDYHICEDCEPDEEEDE